MTAQDIQNERLKIGSFNALDGNNVSKLLYAHAELWRGFVFGRFKYSYLIELRDIQEGLNADTLYLLPVKGREDELLTLCQTFNADEVDFIGGKDACDMLGTWSREQETQTKTLIRVWWD